MLKGYQIVAFRLKGRAGEIDILARRGRVLAVVEVTRRWDPSSIVDWRRRGRPWRAAARR
jgi:Holliday junction resolvase-like predicted endonuclease